MPSRKTLANRTLGGLVLTWLAIATTGSKGETLTSAPNDPDWSRQWALWSEHTLGAMEFLDKVEQRLAPGISADRAWTRTTGRREVVIAILDSGVRWDEPDLLRQCALNTRELPPAIDSRYDGNGDGSVTVEDYIQHPKLSDLNHNSRLDVQDLIRAFSNGVDDDSNGYVDDICGWDFHDHDNDAFDQDNFGHGTRSALYSVAEAGNSHGGVGVCPRCTFIPLRVSNTFLAHGPRVQAAVEYAQAYGVRVLQMALGTLDTSPNLLKAIESAYDHDILPVMAIGDENAHHTNQPTLRGLGLAVGAIRLGPGEDPRRARTFWMANACSNQSARLDVVAPGVSCASEATGYVAGLAALGWSYAQTLGRSVSAHHLKTWIEQTAQTRHADARAAGGRHWSKSVGWGRVNADALLKAIAHDPRPWTLRMIAPQEGTPVASHWPALRGRLEHGDGRVSRVSLEITRNTSSHKSDKGEVDVTEFLDLESGFLHVPATFIQESLGAPHKDNTIPPSATTWIVRITTDGGRTSIVRRNLYEVFDADLLMGMPKQVEASLEGGIVLEDLDGDKRDEIVAGDSTGMIHIMTPEYHRQWHTTGLHDSGSGLPGIFAPMASGSLIQGHLPHVVAVTIDGRIALCDTGGCRAGPSVPRLPGLVPNVLGTPIIAHLGTSQTEGLTTIMIPEIHGTLYLYRPQRAAPTESRVDIIADSSLAVGPQLVASPIVLEQQRRILGGSTDSYQGRGIIWGLEHLGEKWRPLESFPRLVPLIRDKVLPILGEGLSTTLGAISDPSTERFVVGITPFVGRPHLLNSKRTFLSALNLSRDPRHGAQGQKSSWFATLSHPAFGTWRGRPHIFAIGSDEDLLVAMASGDGSHPYQFSVAAWDLETGLLAPEFPKYLVGMPFLGSPLVCDIDPSQEGEEVIVATSNGIIHAWGARAEVDGFPKKSGGWTFSPPALGDWDGDGRRDLVAATREGHILGWILLGSTNTRCSWPTYKQNNRRTGILNGALP